MIKMKQIILLKIKIKNEEEYHENETRRKFSK